MVWYNPFSWGGNDSGMTLETLDYEEEDGEEALIEDCKSITNQSWSVWAEVEDLKNPGLIVPTNLTPSGRKQFPDREWVATSLYPVWGGRSYEVRAEFHIAQKRDRNNPRNVITYPKKDQIAVTRYDFDGDLKDPRADKIKQSQPQKSLEDKLKESVDSYVIKRFETDEIFRDKYLEGQFNSRLKKMGMVTDDDSKETEKIKADKLAKANKVVENLIKDKIRRGQEITPADEIRFDLIKDDPDREIPKVHAELVAREKAETTAEEKLAEIKMADKMRKQVEDDLESRGLIKHGDDESQVIKFARELVNLVPKDGPIAEAVAKVLTGLAARFPNMGGEMPQAVALPAANETQRVITPVSNEVTQAQETQSYNNEPGPNGFEDYKDVKEFDMAVNESAAQVWQRLSAGPLKPTAQDFLDWTGALIDIFNTPEFNAAQNKYYQLFKLNDKTRAFVGLMAEYHAQSQATHDWCVSRIDELLNTADKQIAKAATMLGVEVPSGMTIPEKMQFTLQTMASQNEFMKGVIARTIGVNELQPFINQALALLPKITPTYEKLRSKQGELILTNLKPVSIKITLELRTPPSR